MHIQYSIMDAPPGQILLAETRDGLVFIGLGWDGLNQLTAYAKKHYPGAQIVPSIPDSIHQIEEYIAGKRREFTLKVAATGTGFQHAVWDALMDIPYGQPTTYGELAQKLEKPGAARAIGQACSANPVPIVVPCHRVLAADGALGGYSGGLEWKRWLLDLENA